MKIIREWFHKELGKIVCAEERITEENKRFHIFGKKEKIKFLSKEPKLYNVMFSFYANSDEDLEDIFYNKTSEQKEHYEKLTFIYKSFLNSIDNIEKDLLKYCQEEFQEDYFQYFCYHFVDEDLLVWNETKDLYEYAQNRGLVLFDAIKTAYFRAFSRLVLLVKGGAIGRVKSIDAACTSMQPSNRWFYNSESKGGSLADWGPFVLLPVFKIFGLDYKECSFICSMDNDRDSDMFTQINLLYPCGVANLKTGYGVKSEGSLVVSGTKAYIYVPSPWWKTEYFEIRYENFTNNRRYFYKIDGEGIRYELAEFLRLVRTGEKNFTISSGMSQKISGVMEKFLSNENKYFI